MPEHVYQRLEALSTDALIALLRKLDIAVENVKDELDRRLSDLQDEVEMLEGLLGE